MLGPVPAREAARILGVSTRHVARLAERGELAYDETPLGRLYDRADLERHRAQPPRRGRPPTGPEPRRARGDEETVQVARPGHGLPALGSVRLFITQPAAVEAGDRRIAEYQPGQRDVPEELARLLLEAGVAFRI